MTARSFLARALAHTVAERDEARQLLQAERAAHRRTAELLREAGRGVVDHHAPPVVNLRARCLRQRLAAAEARTLEAESAAENLRQQLAAVVSERDAFQELMDTLVAKAEQRRQAARAATAADPVLAAARATTAKAQAVFAGAAYASPARGRG